jgi:hypothetical protein
VVKWFTTLRQKEWLGNLTSIIEEQWEKRVGISNEWEDENLRAYLTMLAEEISEKTESRVGVHPWNGGWHGSGHRLMVKRKPTEFEDVVRRIQVLGFGLGKLVDHEAVKSALNALLDRKT